MNKPTREQIEHRAIELLLNFDGNDYCDFCRLEETCTGYEKCTSELVKTALEKAEEELKDKLFLTDNQKSILRNSIETLQNATGHQYEEIEYVKDDRSKTKVMAFKWHSIEYIDANMRKEIKHFDTISGTFVSFADETFESGKTYKIEEILNEH